jgi:lysophospholipid acyltransferase (LPLAT)-like uncharacterized protein
MLRAWAATWRVHREGYDDARGWVEQGCVVALLHGELLPIALLHAGWPAVGMVSSSRDGDRAARILSGLGWTSARGSSSRGGRRVAREMLRHLGQGRSAVVAVDGPRGPAGHVHPGASVLSAVGRVPVMMVRARARPEVRLRSWDGFRIPLPFARVQLQYELVPAGRRADVHRALIRGLGTPW